MLKQLFPLLIILLVSCTDDEGSNVPPAAEPFCDSVELETRSDGKSCDEDTQGVCAVLTIEEPQFIDQLTYDWSPDICGFELGDQITFRSEDFTTFWTVVDRAHFITKERVYTSCSIWHQTAFICQENEVVRVSFVNDRLGILDTLHLELRTKTTNIVDDMPGEKRNIVGLWQDRAFTNVANFWINHFVGDDYYEQTWQSYNESVTLNGTEYKDVIKYEFGDNIHSEPHHRFYMEYGLGILAFEVNDRLWIRE